MTPPNDSSYPTLADAQPTQNLWVIGYRDHEGINHLMGMGLAPGTALEVLKVVARNIVIRMGNTRLGIDVQTAQNILVADQPPYPSTVAPPSIMEPSTSVPLGDFEIHQAGQVTGFATHDRPELKAYKKKLLAMGLTPGTPFVVTRIAPLGDPIEIEVRGFKLSLRKEEAAALIVTVV